MSRVRVESFTISVDGFGAGPRQDGQHLIDEMHVAISRGLLGSGERLFEAPDLPVLGCACTPHAATPRAMHLVFGRG